MDYSARLSRDGGGRPLNIWFPPEPSGVYVMGVDTASGSAARDGDSSAAIVLEANTLQEVASFVSSSLIPQEFAEKVAALAIYYRGRARKACFTVIENGVHGDVLIQVLTSEIGHTNLWADRRSLNFNDFRVQWGWRSSQVARSNLIDAARERFKEINSPEYLAKYGPAIRSRVLLEQIPKFVYDENGKATTSKKRGHDDAIIAWCLANLGRDEALRRIEELPKPEKTPTYEGFVRQQINERLDEKFRAQGISDWRERKAEADALDAARIAWDE